MSKTLSARLDGLSTPHLADGCLHAGVPLRCGPAGLLPLTPALRCAGAARPVRHVGGIDVFLEALGHAGPGEVMVIDNGGRLDEACIGDIVAIEARDAGIAGIVVWGLHRDDRELRELGLPVFSLGAFATGPQRLHTRPADAFERASIGAHGVGADDIVVADGNGVLFIPGDRLDAVATAAARVRDTELRQLAAMAHGRSYREQVRFADYLARREEDPGYGLRLHLKTVEAAGEV